MSEKTFRIGISVVILALCAALVLQGFAGRSRRQDICASQNKTLAALRGVIVLATTPPKGEQLTAQQVKRITTFQSKTFALIESARC